MFGVEGTATPLGGERDRNFHISGEPDDDGDRSGWVLKVVHPSEDDLVTDLQNQTLMHLASHGTDLPVPRLRPPLDGAGLDVVWRPAHLAGRRCRVRMYSYLHGVPLHLSERTRDMRVALGHVLAGIDVALHGLQHPAESHGLAWDGQNVERVRGLIPDNEIGVLARQRLRHFTHHAAPLLPQLRHQIIHNDFNPHNVLTKEANEARIVGIIDFGDLVSAPLVQDLATAAAYQIDDTGHPLQGPADMLKAFHTVCPLSPDDIEALFDLIIARLILIITITNWRASAQPENRAYIMRNSLRAEASLRGLANVSCEDAQLYFARALET